MTKPILVYVGHSYHRKTNSSAFFIDILRRNYQLEVIWDESWLPSGKPLMAADINKLNPQSVLFWQTLPKISEMHRLRCRRLIYVPMHDHVVGNPEYGWKQLCASGMRSLNFCRATHDFFNGLGFESIVTQYWPEPATQTIVENNELHLFFWARKQEIGWPTIKLLLGNIRPNRIVLRTAADPGQTTEMPTEHEVAEYNIEIVDGWLDKSSYMKLLTECNLFMAPRLYEGIGQSFLEAMSLGLAVIAPDSPTMNEYIQHGRNGYLYPLARPTPLDFSGLNDIRIQCLQDVESGHHNWRAQEQEILQYLASEAKNGPSISWRLQTLLKS